MAVAPLDLKLTVKGVPELDRLVKRMGVLEKEVNQLNEKLPKAANNIRKVGTSSRQASSGVNKLSDAVKGLAIGYAAIQAIKFSIGKTAELETQTKSLEVLTGSLEKAKSVIKELKDFGAVTPFTSTELIETAKRLKAFGVDTEKLVETTKRLGDIAGATGARLDGIATAYGQIQAKGRLQGEELLQLQERGINLQDELQKMYGLTGEEFRKALEKGRFSAKATELALKRLTDVGGKYANGAIAQSETLNGKFSTLIDNVGRFAATLGSVLSPVLKGLLDQANSLISVFNELFEIGGLERNLRNAGELDDASRQELWKEATAEAERLLKIGRATKETFASIRLNIFQESLKGVARNAGLIKDVIRKVESVKVPELLGGSGNGSGRSKSDTAALKAQKEAERLAARQAEAYARINQELDRSIALNSGVNNYIKQGLRNLFEYQDVVARINKDVEAGRQAELTALAQLKKDQADFNVLKGAATDFGSDMGKFFAEQIPEVNNELTRTEELLKGSYEIVTNGLTNGIQGLIDGTKEWGDILSDVLGNLGNMFLQAGFSALGAGLNIPGFAQGGYVDGPTPALIGEGGQSEYVIPENKMDAAMSRYNSGARGDAVVGGASPTGSGGSLPPEQPSQINISGGVMQMDNTNYIRQDQIPSIVDQASKQGEARALRRLQMSPTTRRKVGV